MSEDISDKFPLQYDEMADRLNTSYAERNLEHGRISEIGRTVDPSLVCVHYPKTGGYAWRCGLVYPVDGASVIVLFPWLTGQDPPVSVRSDVPVDSRRIIGLLDDLEAKIKFYQLLGPKLSGQS